MEDELSESSDSRRRFRKRWIAWAVLALWAGVGAWNVTKPMPAGTNVSLPRKSRSADRGNEPTEVSPSLRAP